MTGRFGDGSSDCDDFSDECGGEVTGCGLGDDCDADSGGFSNNGSGLGDDCRGFGDYRSFFDVVAALVLWKLLQ